MLVDVGRCFQLCCLRASDCNSKSLVKIDFNRNGFTHRIERIDLEEANLVTRLIGGRQFLTQTFRAFYAYAFSAVSMLRSFKLPIIDPMMMLIVNRWWWFRTSFLFARTRSSWSRPAQVHLLHVGPQTSRSRLESTAFVTSCQTQVDPVLKSTCSCEMGICDGLLLRLWLDQLLLHFRRWCFSRLLLDKKFQRWTLNYSITSDSSAGLEKVQW